MHFGNFIRVDVASTKSNSGFGKSWSKSPPKSNQKQDSGRGDQHDDENSHPYFEIATQNPGVERQIQNQTNQQENKNPDLDTQNEL